MGKQGFRWWVLLENGTGVEVAVPSPAVDRELVDLLYGELAAWKEEARRANEATRELRFILARQQERVLELDRGALRPWWKRLFGID